MQQTRSSQALQSEILDLDGVTPTMLTVKSLGAHGHPMILIYLPQRGKHQDEI